MRVLPLLMLAACAARQAPPPTPAVLLVRAPVDASLWLDDQPLGELATRKAGVRLRPGPHRVELRRDGYATRYLEITLAPGERRVLETTLAEAFP